MREKISKSFRNSRWQLSRAFDNQRVHFANLNNAAAEDHFKNLRDMQKATMETNKVLQSQKEDNERNAK